MAVAAPMVNIGKINEGDWILKGIQYVLDEKGKKTAVIVELNWLVYKNSWKTLW